MNKLTIKVCPVCGSAHIERAMTCIDHYSSSEAFYLCRCQDCSFLFTQDFPVEAEIGRYYETPDYISHSDTKKGLMNRVYHWVRSYMLGRKARLVVREAHRKEDVCWISVREQDILPMLCRSEAGRWRQWKGMRRHAYLLRNTSIWI